MTLDAIKLMGTIMKPKQIIGMMHDNLQKELKKTFDRFEMVADATEKNCYFRIDFGKGVQRIPYVDGKQFFEFVNDYAKPYITNGDIINFCILKYSESIKLKPGLFGIAKEKREIEAFIEIYFTDNDGNKEKQTHIIP